MVIKSSPLLLEFYKYWFEKTQNTKRKVYSGYGLCSEVMVFAYQRMDRNYPLAYNLANRIRSEMYAQFKLADLDTELPFNMDINHYREEILSETSHLNVERVEWVKNRIQDGVKES